jgi:hypothetical protein
MSHQSSLILESLIIVTPVFIDGFYGSLMTVTSVFDVTGVPND